MLGRLCIEVAHSAQRVREVAALRSDGHPT
jgi:hypothetical protein